MGQLAPGTLHKYLTGEIVTGDDTSVATNINKVFDAITLAHNDTDNRAKDTYTKSETDAKFYSKTQLDAGQLDNRYFTETELSTGSLDTRYFTETELNNGQLDNRYYTEAELNSGQLDSRYYTEIEMDAVLAGITPDSRAFVTRSQLFTATEGQTLFTLTEGSYAPSFDRIQVYIGGVKQYVGSGDFTETSATSFTLSEGVPEGTKVEATWMEGILAASSLDEVTALKAETTNNRISIERFSDLVTDDWATALMAAHDNLPSTGGEIIVPIQVTIKTPVVLTKKVRLTGVGHTSISGDSTRATSVIIKDGNFDGITLKGGGSVMQGIQVDGATGNGGDGVVIAGARIALVDVATTRQGREGIRIGTSAGDNCNLWRLTNIISLYNGGHGLYAHHGPATKSDTNAGLLLGIDARGNTGDGICIGNSTDSTYVGVCAQSNGGTGVRIKSGATGNQFFSPYMELNGTGNTKEFMLEAGSKQNFVYGQVSGTAYNMIEDLGTSNFIFTFDVSQTDSPPFIRSLLTIKELVLNNPDYVGNWKFSESDTAMLLQLFGTSGNRDVEIKHGSTGIVTTKVQRLAINGGQSVTGWLHKSGTLNFPNILANSTAELSLTATGAALGDPVCASPNGVPEAGLIWSAYVSAVDTVTIRLLNSTASAIDPASIPWRVDVFKHY